LLTSGRLRGQRFSPDAEADFERGGGRFFEQPPFVFAGAAFAELVHGADVFRACALGVKCVFHAQVFGCGSDQAVSCAAGVAGRAACPSGLQPGACSRWAHSKTHSPNALPGTAAGCGSGSPRRRWPGSGRQRRGRCGGWPPLMGVRGAVRSAGGRLSPSFRADSSLCGAL